MGYGTDTSPFTGAISSGTLTDKEGTITLNVTIPSAGVYEGTYTLYVIVEDTLANPGTGTTGAGTLWMDLTKPRQYANPAGGFNIQIDAGTVDPLDSNTWDDFEEPNFNTNLSRNGAMRIWGVAADTSTTGLFVSAPAKVVVYYIYAGASIPTGSPTGYPFSSEADLLSKHSDAEWCGESPVYIFNPPTYAGTWSINWNNRNIKAGGFWFVSFVYDQAGNVIDGGGGSGLADEEPPVEIGWLKGTVGNGDTVVLDWSSNLQGGTGIPRDDTAVDYYCVYRSETEVTKTDLENSTPIRVGLARAEEHSVAAGTTKIELNFKPVYEVIGVYGSKTTQTSPCGNVWEIGTGTDYYTGSSTFYYAF